MSSRRSTIVLIFLSAIRLAHQPETGNRARLQFHEKWTPPQTISNTRMQQSADDSTLSPQSPAQMVPDSNPERLENTFNSDQPDDLKTPSVNEGNENPLSTVIPETPDVYFDKSIVEQVFNMIEAPQFNANQPLSDLIQQESSSVQRGSLIPGESDTNQKSIFTTNQIPENPQTVSQPSPPTEPTTGEDLRSVIEELKTSQPERRITAEESPIDNPLFDQLNSQGFFLPDVITETSGESPQPQPHSTSSSVQAILDKRLALRFINLTPAEKAKKIAEERAARERERRANIKAKDTEKYKKIIADNAWRKTKSRALNRGLPIPEKNGAETQVESATDSVSGERSSFAPSNDMETATDTQGTSGETPTTAETGSMKTVDWSEPKEYNLDTPEIVTVSPSEILKNPLYNAIVTETPVFNTVLQDIQPISTSAQKIRFPALSPEERKKRIQKNNAEAQRRRRENLKINNPGKWKMILSQNAERKRKVYEMEIGSKASDKSNPTETPVEAAAFKRENASGESSTTDVAGATHLTSRRGKKTKTQITSESQAKRSKASSSEGTTVNANVSQSTVETEASTQEVSPQIPNVPELNSDETSTQAVPTEFNLDTPQVLTVSPNEITKNPLLDATISYTPDWVSEPWAFEPVPISGEAKIGSNRKKLFPDLPEDERRIAILAYNAELKRQKLEKMKIDEPEKYQQLLEKDRQRHKQSGSSKKRSRKRPPQVPENEPTSDTTPAKRGRGRPKMYTHLSEDERRQMLAEAKAKRQKKYLEKMKEEDPEKFKKFQQKHREDCQKLREKKRHEQKEEKLVLTGQSGASITSASANTDSDSQTLEEECEYEPMEQGVDLEAQDTDGN